MSYDMTPLAALNLFFDSHEALTEYETEQIVKGMKLYAEAYASQHRQQQGLREALEDVDTVLMQMEDYLHGEDGTRITKMRGKIQKALSTPPKEDTKQ